MIHNAVRYKEFFHGRSSFPKVFFEQTARFEKTALVDEDNGDGYSFQEFMQSTTGYESFLYHTLKQSEKKLVITICGNSLKYLSVVLAITNLGYTILPLNPSLKRYEINNIVSNLEVNSIITDNFNSYMFLLDDNNVLSFQEIEERKSKVPNSLVFDRNHSAFYFLSSGTTGTPKIIEISHGSVIALFNQLRSSSKPISVEFTTVDKVYGVLPYFHLGGLFTALSMLFLGATVFVNNKWNQEHFLTNLHRNQITTVNLVPPVLNFFEKIKPTLPDLKKVFVGASKVDSKQINRLQLLYPSIKFIQLYGMTEAGLILFMTPAGNDDLSKIGIPFPGIQAKIVNQELLIKAPTMMNRYVNELNRFDKNDWFPTGDLAEIDCDNQLRIIGRTKSVIKIRGWQINPEELEEMIAERSENSEAVLHYLEFLQNPMLILQTTTSPERTRSLIRENLISYKHPFWIVRTTNINRTDSGKIRRNDLESILPTS